MAGATTVNELQELIDALAAELERPVGLDDRDFCSLAYSSHVDEIDPVRLSSILHRRAPRAVIEYLASVGIHDAGDHVRLAANPALGMSARVCLPLRFEGALLGYVWLFDEPAPLGAAELDTARRFASEAAAMLFRLRRLESADRARERELLARLLGVSEGDPQQAADALTAVGFVAAAPLAAVAVLRAASAAGAAIDDAVRVRLATAADRLRRSSPAHHVLCTAAGDDVAVLLMVGSESELERRVARLDTCAADALSGHAHWSCVIGVGAPRAALSQAPEAYREARQATAAGLAQPQLRPVVQWDRLGASRTLLQLLASTRPAAAVPGCVRTLLAAPDADALIPTALAYLERAGDAKATAQELYLHRSTLYNRLHRIEAVAGVDLRSGDQRLELHLGLRLWQLAGGTMPGS